MSDQRGAAQGSPLIKSRRVVIVVVILELLFIGYLVSRAFRADDWTGPWYATGAAGLALIVGVVWWTRLRRPS